MNTHSLDCVEDKTLGWAVRKRCGRALGGSCRSLVWRLFSTLWCSRAKGNTVPVASHAGRRDGQRTKFGKCGMLFACCISLLEQMKTVQANLKKSSRRKYTYWRHRETENIGKIENLQLRTRRKARFQKAWTTTTNSSTGHRKLGPMMAQPASDKN